MTMQGKIVMVTGANSGIGYATVEGLAAQGATLILHARSKEKGEKAREDIARKTGNTNIHLMLADLSSIEQLKELADQVKAKFDHLDVLINNAALVPTRRTLTKDGLEAQFAINHLSYFILGNLLLPHLEASGAGRMINVSSNLHAVGKVDFENLQAEKRYEFYPVGGPGWGQYSNTKLMNILFTKEMARRLGEDAKVTVNAVHPGLIGTNLSRAMPKFIHRIYLSMVAKPEKGAETSIYLATSPDVAKITGQYFTNKQIAESSPASHQIEVALRLWEVSAKLAGISTR
ncbi:MAG: SDR family oxidoreductase [Anaerolineae bacterium]